MKRCHDHQCGARHRCERWITRERAAPGAQHYSTLKAGWIPHADPCDRYQRKRLTPPAIIVFWCEYLIEPDA